MYIDPDKPRSPKKHFPGLTQWGKFSPIWSLPEIKSCIQKNFNGQSEIPLILKDISSTKISNKGLYTGIIFTLISKWSLTNIYNSG